MLVPVPASCATAASYEEFLTGNVPKDSLPPGAPMFAKFPRGNEHYTRADRNNQNSGECTCPNGESYTVSDSSCSFDGLCDGGTITKPCGPTPGWSSDKPPKRPWRGMGVRCARGNVYEKVGEETAGGTCTCPDGAAYQVSATTKECASLHCVGGTVSKACQNQSQADPRAAGMGVRCANSVAAFYSVDGVIRPREITASANYSARLGVKTDQAVVTDRLAADQHNYGAGEGEARVAAAWIKIDLGQGSSAPVAALKLVGRQEGKRDRGQDLTIRVGNTGIRSDALCRKGVDISTHAVTTVPCAEPLGGRYVTMYRAGKALDDHTLELYSAQVFSKAAPDCATPGRLELCRRDNGGNDIGCTAFHKGWQNNSRAGGRLELSARTPHVGPQYVW